MNSKQSAKQLFVNEAKEKYSFELNSMFGNRLVNSASLVLRFEERMMWIPMAYGRLAKWVLLKI